MTDTELHGILDFLRAAEGLKRHTRTSWKSNGVPESVAEHTWRLCLMVLLLRDAFDDVDVSKLIQLCIVHDLGEALHGDISAVQQAGAPPKASQERADLMELLQPLPRDMHLRLLALWDEYEAAQTKEARLAKACDKLETILQHNQAATPADFDYRFNLAYGRQYADVHPVIARLRALLDSETEQRASERDAR